MGNACCSDLPLPRGCNGRPGNGQHDIITYSQTANPISKPSRQTAARPISRHTQICRTVQPFSKSPRPVPTAAYMDRSSTLGSLQSPMWGPADSTRARQVNTSLHRLATTIRYPRAIFTSPLRTIASPWHSDPLSPRERRNGTPSIMPRSSGCIICRSSESSRATIRRSDQGPLRDNSVLRRTSLRRHL